MDYNSVKFIVSCFQTYYPESLGQVLVVDSPWIFNGCYQIIKPWLDPVVASKIKFISSSALVSHIDKEHIPKCLSDDDDAYEFAYIAPTDADVAEMEAIRAKTDLCEEHMKSFKIATAAFFEANSAWAEIEEQDACSAHKEREAAIKSVQEAYKSLIPFIR
jgi:hypothetical protein